jgi:hypothetical protein
MLGARAFHCRLLCLAARRAYDDDCGLRIGLLLQSINS